MKKSTKSFLLLTAVTALGCTIIAGCKSDKVPDQDPYDESGFASGGGSTSIFNPLETDEGFAIDGKLDEQVWQNKEWFSYHDSGVNIDVTTAFGEKGAYVALRTDDSGIYYNSARDIWLNSSFELYVDNSESTEMSERTLQVRIDCGKIETYFYLPESSGGYPWKLQYRPVYGKIFVDGKLNSGNAKGMSCEMLVSWEAFGYDIKSPDFVIPNSIKLFPAYSKAAGVDSKSREAWCVNTEGYTELYRYWTFGNDGYTLKDQEGALIGDSSFGRVKTPGWDTGTDGKGAITSTEGGNQFLYFTGENFETPEGSEDYAFTAKLTYKNAINDAYPRMGITLAADDTNLIGYFIQMWGVTETSFVGQFFERTYSASKWEMKAETKNDSSFNVSKGLRLTGVKRGATMFVFADTLESEQYSGEFLGMYTFNDIGGAAVPGFYTMGCSVEYSDYALTTDDNKIAELLSGYVSNLTDK